LRVLRTDAIRRRRSWSDAIYLGDDRVFALDVEGVLELLDLALQLLAKVVRQVARLADLLVDLALGAEVLAQLVLKPRDLRRRRAARGCATGRRP
jgi:hypothetical protein